MKFETGARVAVAGAGAMGSAVALGLARMGLAVTVFDPRPLGDNASGVAAGMLAPVAETLFDPVSADHLDLLRAARNRWPDFAEGLDVGLRRDGLRIEGEAAWLAGVRSRLDILGVAVETRDGGLFIDEDWRLEARPALVALRDAARSLGARFEARALTPDDRTDFDVVVLAMGAVIDRSWAPELAALTPVKGQILRADRGPADGPVLRGQGVYVCPGESPAIGATMEVGRDDLAADPAATEGLRQAAIRLRPELADAAFAIEVGVRATTPDGLPLVGWSEGGAMLAAGARRNGWLLGPLVAEVVGAYLKGDNPGREAAAFDPRRFSRT
ncbi:MAG: FAD-dependent oxidoreductase [Caulobacter sp.]|nr:FAD-dependent oxidoreductase [Caulobacter sp.]